MTTHFDEWRAAKRKEAELLSWGRFPKVGYFSAMYEGYDLLDLLEAALREAAECPAS